MKLLFTLIAFAPMLLFAQEKHALLIAVGDYAPETRWKSISSENDLVLWNEVLKKYNFESENITTLLNEQATKEGILKSFEDLKSSVKKGDYVIIHFSGHGQQIFDDNGDELDGMDESIVPFDANLRYEEGIYEGENHIRDEVLGLFIREIREKLGTKGQLIFILDSCHSGTATRGGATARGTEIPFAPKGFFTKTTTKQEVFNLNIEDPKGLSPWAFYSASSQGQLNYETKIDNVGYGSLSYALCTQLLTAEENISFYDIYARSKNDMQLLVPGQKPQFEGDKEVILFNSEGRKTALIYPKEVIDNKVLKLDIGELGGYTKGNSVVCITLNNACNSGLITESTLTTCTVKLDHPISTDIDISKMSIQISSKKFGDYKLNVKLIDLTEEQQAKVSIIVTGNDYINIVEEDPTIEISYNSTKNKFEVFNQFDTYLFSSKLVDYADEEEFETAMKYYAQSEYLRKMLIDDPKINVEMGIVFGEKSNGVFIPADTTFDLSNVTIKDGQFIRLIFKNNGYKDIFVSVVDIMPDSKFVIAIPQGNRTPDEYKVEAFETRSMAIFEMSAEPSGTELFKIFYSKSPLDLKAVQLSRGTARGVGDSSDIEKAFGTLFTVSGARGSKDASNPPVKTAGITVENWFFELIK